jgi:hypothetical protein
MHIKRAVNFPFTTTNITPLAGHARGRYTQPAFGFPQTTIVCMGTQSEFLEDVLARAFDGVDDEDVRLFYEYFEELKSHVRKHLSQKAKVLPGESAVAQSALLSLFCDATLARVPLTDIDEYGYPALWPLLLKYVERHCNKWNKYYRAKKRKGVEVSLSSDDSSAPGIDPPDHRSAADDEEVVGATLEALYAKLTPRQRRVADLTALGHTLKEIATALDCSESLVSLEKKAIRVLLETG